jgi:hypothetical protein
MLYRVRWLILLIFAACAVVPAAAQTDVLRQFASQMNLRDVDGFVTTVISLRTTGKLPERYVTKAQAERRGWRPGSDLCRAVPGGSIGGDRFGNRERQLPDAPRRTWREADLDFACGSRGAKRLVWSSDGLYFVTVDHYESFRRVPP